MWKAIWLKVELGNQLVAQVIKKTFIFGLKHFLESRLLFERVFS